MSPSFPSQGLSDSSAQESVPPLLLNGIGPQEKILSKASAQGSLPSPLASEPSQPLDAQGRSGRISDLSVQEILKQQHGTRVCRCGDCCELFAVFLMIVLFVWLANTQADNLVKVAEAIEGLGVLGPVIFFFLFIWVGTPIGYNWTTLCLLVGFAYGWHAVVFSNIGTIASSVFSYYSSQYFMQSCMQRRMQRLGEQKRLYLLAVISVIESGRGGFLMQIVMRVQPAQTFGLTNAFLGVFTTIPMWKYIATTLAGSEHTIIMCTSMGKMVRDLGSVEEATESTSGQVNIFVNVAVNIVVITGGFFFARYLAVHVLPGMMGDEHFLEAPADAPAYEAALPGAPVFFTETPMGKPRTDHEEAREVQAVVIDEVL